MRVIVDRERFESNALCMAAAPDIFRVDDGDVLRGLEESPGEELRSQVVQAVRACPMMALELLG